MVIQGLVKSKVFGTGWKVSNRKFPSVHVIQDYMVVFDASEIWNLDLSDHILSFINIFKYFYTIVI